MVETASLKVGIPEPVLNSKFGLLTAGIAGSNPAKHMLFFYKKAIKMGSIKTFSGEFFDVKHFDDYQINGIDIAKGLSNACRFGGQTSKFYSVAQHSVFVARMLPSDLKFAGLLHDAHEFVMGDVVSPYKDYYHGYREIQNELQDAIYRRFSVLLNDTDKNLIKQVDGNVCEMEKMMTREFKDCFYFWEPETSFHRYVKEWNCCCGVANIIEEIPT